MFIVKVVTVLCPVYIKCPICPMRHFQFGQPILYPRTPMKEKLFFLEINYIDGKWVKIPSLITFAILSAVKRSMRCGKRKSFLGGQSRSWELVGVVIRRDGDDDVDDQAQRAL